MCLPLKNTYQPEHEQVEAQGDSFCFVAIVVLASTDSHKTKEAD